MGVFLNRQCKEFDSVVNSKIYVDKTDMINFICDLVNTEQRYVCVSRPRRFGKSIAANMISSYFVKGQDTRYLFENRKLGKCENWDRYLNKFDVVKIDLAEEMANNGGPKKALDYIKRHLIEDFYDEYKNIEKKDDDTVAGLMDRVNKATGNKFVVIIDEWECFFRDDRNNKEIQLEYVDFLRGLFKGNRAKEFLALAYITGILPIKRYNSESALNNFTEYTMLEPKKLVRYIGFNEEEVYDLSKKYNMSFDELKAWYDGYNYKWLNVPHVYCPNSVVQAVFNESFENYWSKTVAFNSLSTYITMNFDGLKDAIVEAIGGNNIPVKVNGFQNDMTSFVTKDDVLTVLIHLGYLAYDSETKTAYIPNKEVREIFEGNVEISKWDDVVNAIENSKNLLEATLDGDEETVAECVEECHNKNISIIKYNDENSLACTVRLAYYTAIEKYEIIREFPTGRGFADIVLIPKKNVESPAIVIELKWKKEAETAIKQIKEKKYCDSLKDWTGEVVLVGISYEKTKDKSICKHSCKIAKVIK